MQQKFPMGENWNLQERWTQKLLIKAQALGLQLSARLVNELESV